MLSGQDEDAPLGHGTLYILLLNNDVLFENFDSENLAGGAMLGQHDFAEAPFAQYFKQIKVSQAWNTWDEVSATRHRGARWTLCGARFHISFFALLRNKNITVSLVIFFPVCIHPFLFKGRSEAETNY